jgi:hypothetical protein
MLHAVNPYRRDHQDGDELTPAEVHIVTQAHTTFLDWKQTHMPNGRV